MERISIGYCDLTCTRGYYSSSDPEGKIRLGSVTIGVNACIFPLSYFILNSNVKPIAENGAVLGGATPVSLGPLVPPRIPPAAADATYVRKIMP